MRSLLLSAALVLPLASLSACTSTVTGNGGSSGGGTGGTDTSAGSGGTSPGSSSSSDSNDQGPGPGAETAEYEALFGAPESTSLTEDSVTGLWAGSTYYDDLRLRFGPSSVVIAMKCSSASKTVGAKIVAQVTATSLRILESRQVGNEYESCSIKVRPQTIRRCDSYYDSGCFWIEGATLSFNGVALFSTGSSSPNSDFTKLSD